MTHDSSRRNFLRSTLYTAGAAGAAIQLGAPNAFAQIAPVKVKAPDTELQPINLSANTLSIGPSAKALEAMHRHARARGLPLAAAALDIADSDELPPRARGTIGACVCGTDAKGWFVRAVARPVSWPL